MEKAMDEFTAVKSIPGYEAVLKTVLKSQIKMLVEQLNAQTGEEVILLTASLEDGTFSTLGSESGKMFLDHNSNIKTQFYGFCMKEQDKNHGKRKAEAKAIPAIKKLKTPVESHPKQMPERKDKPQIIIVPVQSSVPTVKPSTPVQQPSSSQSLLKQSPVAKSNPGTFKSDTSNASQTFLYMEDTVSGATSIVPFGEDIEDDDQGFLGISDDEAVDSDYFEGQTPKVKVVKVQSSSAQGTPSGKSADKRRRVREYKYRYKSKAKPLAVMEHPIAPAATLSASLQAKLDKLQEKNKNCCSKCGKLFLREDQLEIHMRSHTAEAPFRCKHCGIQFRNKTNMNKHVRVQHDSELDINF